MRSGVLFCVIYIFVYGNTIRVSFDGSTEVRKNEVSDKEITTESELREKSEEAVSQNLIGNTQKVSFDARSEVDKYKKFDQGKRTDTGLMNNILVDVLQKLSDPNDSEMKCCWDAIKKLKDSVAHSIAKDIHAQLMETAANQIKKESDHDQIYDVNVNVPKKLLNYAVKNKVEGRRSKGAITGGAQHSRHTVHNFTSTISTSSTTSTLYTPTTEENIWRE